MSKVTASLLVSIGGLLLTQVGFSDSCSGEITAKVIPILISLGGAFSAHVFHNQAVGRSPILGRSQ